MDKEILKKIRHYCAFQERTHEEAKEKLQKLGVNKLDSERILADLVEEGYLNEERYAIEFAGGKFRMNKWGKQKIISALKSKGISNYCVKKAISAIANNDYRNTIDKLIKKKLKEIGKESAASRKMKVRNYMLQKGYEYDIIMEYLGDLA